MKRNIKLSNMLPHTTHDDHKFHIRAVLMSHGDSQWRLLVKSSLPANNRGYYLAVLSLDDVNHTRMKC